MRIDGFFGSIFALWRFFTGIDREGAYDGVSVPTRLAHVATGWVLFLPFCVG